LVVGPPRKKGRGGKNPRNYHLEKKEEEKRKGEKGEGNPIRFSEKATPLHSLASFYRGKEEGEGAILFSFKKGKEEGGVDASAEGVVLGQRFGGGRRKKKKGRGSAPFPPFSTEGREKGEKKREKKLNDTSPL